MMQLADRRLVLLTASLFSLPALPQSEQSGPAEAQNAHCVSHLASRVNMSPLFGDREAISEACACASARAKSDSAVASAVAELQPSTQGKAGAGTYVALAAVVLECGALAVKRDAGRMATVRPQYFQALASALLVPDRLPAYTSASAIAPNECMPKSYPEIAVRAGAEGTTLLEYYVEPTGRQTKVQIAKSSGDTPFHKLLDFHAAAAGASCKFSPATESGEAKAGWARIEVVWKLQ